MPVPGARHAVDGELAEQPVPRALSGRLPGDGDADPWGWWTRAEVCAKLFDVPILVWISTRGWPAEGDQVVGDHRLQVSTHRTHGLVLSLGSLVPEGSR